MRKILLASTALTAVATAYVNTNAGGKLYVCATPQNSDLSLAQYQALVWVEVGAVGSHGQSGPDTNILTYDTWNTTVVQKSKGLTNAGDPEIEVARLPTDAGQIILRAAALTKYNYALKIVRPDAPSAGGTGTTIYNRGLITGPKRPNGRNEDFDLEMFTAGLQQLEIVVDPTAGGNAPVNTVAPAITQDGTPAPGETITINNGTFTGDAVITYTYQWYQGGVPIAGATASALLLTAAQSGKVITGVVTATNAYGSAIGTSAPTPAVA